MKYLVVQKIEYNQLINKLINYQKNQHIQNIVIIHHTQPKKIFVKDDLELKLILILKI